MGSGSATPCHSPGPTVSPGPPGAADFGVWVLVVSPGVSPPFGGCHWGMSLSPRYVQSLLDIMEFHDKDPEDQATLGQ